jgi:hypothetical protein
LNHSWSRWLRAAAGLALANVPVFSWPNGGRMILAARDRRSGHRSLVSGHRLQWGTIRMHTLRLAAVSPIARTLNKLRDRDHRRAALSQQKNASRDQVTTGVF